MVVRVAATEAITAIITGPSAPPLTAVRMAPTVIATTMLATCAARFATLSMARR